MKLALEPPQPLDSTHHLDDFDCGEPTLDEWLVRRALTNQASGASRTFVVVDAQRRVVGYYALAAGTVSHASAPGRVRRNMPDPIPVLVLGRLAVDRRVQGRKVGAGLLQDAVHRARLVAEHAGVRALLVHVLHDAAAKFYANYGFSPSPLHAKTWMLRLER